MYPGPRGIFARVLLFLLLLAWTSSARRLSGRAPAIPAISNDAGFRGFFSDVEECANAPVPFLVYSGGNGTVETQLPTLSVEGVWKSSLGAPDLDDITLCANTGLDRHHMLEGQCASWGGPMVAVLYMTLEMFDTSNALLLEEAKAKAGALHAQLEGLGRCSLTLVLASEAVGTEAAWAYPYNSLRNQAIAHAATKVVFLLDVDFLVSNGTRERLMQPWTYRELLVRTHERREAVVFPAFETGHHLDLEAGRQVAYASAAAGSKRYVKAQMMDGNLTQFAPFFERGHGATDYKRWFSTIEPYPVTFVKGYEPFLLLSRLHVPWFDERFRGYGWDKITHIFQMVNTGFTLVVHPQSYVVHRPHPPSAGYNQTFTGPAYSRGHKATKEMERLDVIGMEMMRDVLRGKYPAFGVTALAGCRPVERWFGALGPVPNVTDRVARGFRLNRTAKLEFMKGRLQQPVVEWW